MASSRDQSGALSGNRRSVPSGRTSYQWPPLRRRLTKVVSLFTFARFPRRDDADDIVVSLHIHNEKDLAACKANDAPAFLVRAAIVETAQASGFAKHILGEFEIDTALGLVRLGLLRVPFEVHPELYGQPAMRVNA